MVRSGIGVAAALASLALSLSANAQTLPFRCGPDCTTRGQYVLCNDAFDRSMTAAGGVTLSNFLETACASFAAPAAQFQVTGFVALFGGAQQDLLAVVRIDEETGHPHPGRELFCTGADIPPAGAPGFSGLLFMGQTISATTAFRVCIQQQLDSPDNTLTRPILFDADGVQGHNEIANPPTWCDVGQSCAFSTTAITGDFVIRAVVSYNDFTPWNPGGVCAGGADAGPSDMGVAPDSGSIGVDTGLGAPDGAADAGAGSNDAGVGSNDGGAGSNDGGAGSNDGGGPADVAAGSLDAGSAEDAATSDAGTLDAGGPIDSGAVRPAPTIAAISPNQGENTAPVAVVITGSNFVSGLSLKIGTIPADKVDVPGPTSILAEVPANIAPGVYDVVVQNPDKQTAVLSKGYTVTGKTGGAPPASKCGCSSAVDRSGARGSLILWIGLLGALGVIARRRPVARRIESLR